MKNFTDLRLQESNLDIYIIRNSILRSIDQALDLLSGKILDIGCGQMPYKKYLLENSGVEEYIGLDIETAKVYNKVIKPDFKWDGKSMPFDDNSFDCAMATEVLEHCPDPEIVLKEVFRVIKPGGSIFFTVPFLWNLHEVPNDEYRYTPFALERHLKNCGFSYIELNATGGWHASMAQMMGLWVRRSPMSDRKRKWLSLLILPIMKFLLKKDSLFDTKFVEGQMITGIYGTATK